MDLAVFEQESLPCVLSDSLNDYRQAKHRYNQDACMKNKEQR